MIGFASLFDCAQEISPAFVLDRTIIYPHDNILLTRKRFLLTHITFYLQQMMKAMNAERAITLLTRRYAATKIAKDGGAAHASMLIVLQSNLSEII